MHVAAPFPLRAPSEGTAVSAVPSVTSDLALVTSMAALAASDAACKHHTSAQDAARALLQQAWGLPCSTPQEVNAPGRS